VRWLALAALAVLLVLPAALGPYALTVAINVLFFAYRGS